MTKPNHPPFPPAMCYVFGKHEWKPVLRVDWVRSREGWSISQHMAWKTGDRCPLCGASKEQSVIGPVFFPKAD